MYRRKRTRQTTEKERVNNENMATKLPKTDESNRQEQHEQETPEKNDNQELVQSNDGTTGPSNQSNIDAAHDEDRNEIFNLAGESSDDILAQTVDLLREADILMASVDLLRRQNNDENVPETTDAVHQPANSGDSTESSTSGANSTTATTSSQASSSSRASGSVQRNINQTNSTNDDSIVVIDDLDAGSVQPNARDNDQDVIFITEVPRQQRILDTIDLCETPDTSFSAPPKKGRMDTNDSPQKSCGMGIGRTKCPICLDMFSMDEILSTICGHLFCEPCIKNTIKTRKKCPMCNRPLKLNQIHRIYLDHNL